VADRRRGRGRLRVMAMVSQKGNRDDRWVILAVQVDTVAR